MSKTHQASSFQIATARNYFDECSLKIADKNIGITALLMSFVELVLISSNNHFQQFS
jgi:hypothetical protein